MRYIGNYFFEPLIKIQEIPSGQRFSWMDELGIKEVDTFSYVLNSAEEAYQRIHMTNSNLEAIKSNLIGLSDSGIAVVLNNLTSLASQIAQDLKSAYVKYSQQK